MTETPTTGDEHWEKTIDLPTGCQVKVDETRSLVELPIPRVRGDCNDETTAISENDGNHRDSTTRRKWKAISSAIWKGGLFSFASESEPTAQHEDAIQTDSTPTTPIRVFNFKVPLTYDGLNPEPKSLLRNAIRSNYASEATSTPEHDGHGHEDSTVGMMTAASMRSLRTATRSAGGIVVDVIVTAGITNSRAAGAAADFFGILPPEAKKSDSSHRPDDNTGSNHGGENTIDDDKPQTTDPSSSSKPGLKQRSKRPPPGTINTVVVINGCSLTQEAMIEAYAITIEAKCGACADYNVTCAKQGKLAQGTGTDCAVLLCPVLPPELPSEAAVQYAGKHCLLAELIGQAVREATGEAILSNLHHAHGGSLLKYHLWRYLKLAKGLLKGARPCVPERPMDPVPRAPLTVLGLGIVLVLLCYWLQSTVVGLLIPRSATVLLAAAVWDRCLPEPPLSVHPVVLAGTMISLATNQWIPEKVFRSPVLGFCGGLTFLVVTLFVFVGGAHLFVSALRWAEAATSDTAAGTAFSSSFDHDQSSIPAYGFFLSLVQKLVAFSVWVLEVVLFKTTFSLQLLCTIALQMAGFLERSQLKEARAQLSWLCSRDPTHLNAEELAGGTLESLSENLSDGTVAPWFWYALFGPVGALGYRVANTLDSRIGYRGGRYEWFGKASARFDDLINLVPARLTALFLCLASAVVDGCSPLLGLKTAREDRNQCSSPNAGWPMGAMAGILGVKLEKRGEYCLGKSIDNVRNPTHWDIRKGHTVAQLGGGIALVAAMGACALREQMARSQ